MFAHAHTALFEKHVLVKLTLCFYLRIKLIQENVTPFSKSAFKRQDTSLRKMCPYSELFWSIFFRIWAEYGEIHFSRSAFLDFIGIIS